MELSEYQAEAWAYDQHQAEPERALTIALLGLGGEVGTLQTNQKKIVRDGPVHRDHRLLAIEDLGDILWYIADTATWLGVDLGDVASANLAKIASRWPRHSAVLPPHPPASPAGAGPLLVRDHGIGPARLFDGGHMPVTERLPRRMTVHIAPSPRPCIEVIATR
jgi:hypothetical protein